MAPELHSRTPLSRTYSPAALGPLGRAPVTRSAKLPLDPPLLPAAQGEGSR